MKFNIILIIIISAVLYFCFIPEMKRQIRWSKNIDIAKYHQKQLGRLNDSLEKYIGKHPEFEIYSNSFEYHNNQVHEHVWSDK